MASRGGIVLIVVSFFFSFFLPAVAKGPEKTKRADNREKSAVRPPFYAGVFQSKRCLPHLKHLSFLLKAHEPQYTPRSPRPNVFRPHLTHWDARLPKPHEPQSLAGIPELKVSRPHARHLFFCVPNPHEEHSMAGTLEAANAAPARMTAAKTAAGTTARAAFFSVRARKSAAWGIRVREPCSLRRGGPQASRWPQPRSCP